MKYTEEEAKTKACPVGKTRASFDDNWDKGCCVASNCMAWRWVPEPHPDADLTKVVVKLVRVRGYCGLAGPT